MIKVLLYQWWSYTKKSIEMYIPFRRVECESQFSVDQALKIFKLSKFCTKWINVVICISFFYIHDAQLFIVFHHCFSHRFFSFRHFLLKISNISCLNSFTQTFSQSYNFSCQFICNEKWKMAAKNTHSYFFYEQFCFCEEEEEEEEYTYQMMLMFRTERRLKQYWNVVVYSSLLIYSSCMYTYYYSLLRGEYIFTTTDRNDTY